MDLKNFSSRERINRLLQQRKQYLKSYKGGHCLYDCCTENAILSHTFSKEASLRTIADNGQLIHFDPQWKNDRCNLVFNPIGINDASAFHGFCQPHDSLFKNLDARIINTEMDAILQVYRSISRWIYINERSSKFQREYFTDLKDSRLDTSEKHCSSIILELNNELVELFNKLQEIIKLYSASYNAVLGKRRNIKIANRWSILYVHLDYQIPAALCTNSCCEFHTSKGVFPTNIIWNVVPGENKTDIMIILDTNTINEHLSENDHKLSVEEYWDIICQSDLTILECIEAAMMTNEEWFLSPKVYSSISDEKKKTMEIDIRYKCFGSYVWDLVDYSIFDDIRSQLISIEKDEKIKKRAEEKLKYVPEMPSQAEIDAWEAELSQKIYDQSFYEH